MMPHAALCVNICGWVCTLKVDKGYQDIFILFSLRAMPTVNLFVGKKIKPGHLSLVSWKKSLCGKNALSVLREWNKP